MKRLLFVCATLVLGAASAHAQAVQVDSGIAAYQKASGVSGNINSVGSDTMNNMMALWAETFRKCTRTSRSRSRARARARRRRR